MRIFATALMFIWLAGNIYAADELSGARSILATKDCALIQKTFNVESLNSIFQALDEEIKEKKFEVRARMEVFDEEADRRWFHDHASITGLWKISNRLTLLKVEDRKLLSSRRKIFDLSHEPRWTIRANSSRTYTIAAKLRSDYKNPKFYRTEISFDPADPAFRIRETGVYKDSPKLIHDGVAMVKVENSQFCLNLTRDALVCSGMAVIPQIMEDAMSDRPTHSTNSAMFFRFYDIYLRDRSCN